MGDNEVLSLFLHESGQQLDEMDRLLLEAEATGRWSEGLLNELFRLVHTLKGSLAMYGYEELAETAHQLENVWQQARVLGAGLPQALWPEITGCAFDFSAYLRAALDSLGQGSMAAWDDGPLLDRLALLLSRLGMTGSTAEGPDQAVKGNADKVGERPADYLSYIRYQVYLQPTPMVALRAFLLFRAAAQVSQRCYSLPQNLQSHPELDEQIGMHGFELGFIPKPDRDEAAVRALLSRQPLCDRLEVLSQPAPAQLQTGGGAASALVGVSQARINSLIDQSGEIMAVQTELARRLRGEGRLDRETERLLQALSRHSLDLAGGLGQLGLTEIKTLFLRMQRLARDLLVKSGKQAEIIVRGGELTLDKSVLEAVSEMLLHAVRNAVDHGIETPEQRLATGKTPQGLICLEAHKKNGRLRVIVSDDGQGVSSQRVLAVAAEKGLLNKEPAAYTRAETFEFLLLSGFSTRQEVTQTSGRGVGLDAVQHMVRKIGGSMQISGEEGRGTSISFDLPLSLNLVEALRVTTTETCYLPVSAVKRVLRDDDSLSADAELRLEAGVYQRLPLPEGPERGFVVLFELEQGNFFLRCQTVGETYSFLVKPLPSVLVRLLGRDNPYSGCVQDSLGGVYFLLNVEKLAAQSPFN